MNYPSRDNSVFYFPSVLGPTTIVERLLGYNMFFYDRTDARLDAE